MRIVTLILALVIGVISFNVAGAASGKSSEIVRSGNAAYKAKQYGAAAKFYKEAVEKGNAQAAYNLGVLYRKGLGVKRDYGEAARFYKIAEEKNYVSAYFALGTLYNKGLGVKQDYFEAARLYKLAAAKNRIRATNALGILYKLGRGVEKDYSEAARLFKIAADKNNMSGVYNLAQMHHSGKGVKQDFKEARRLFEISAAEKNFNSMYMLATMYDGGQGVARNPAKTADLIYELMLRGHDFTRNEIVTNWKKWDKKFRKLLQKKMKSEGYYKGPISGHFGPSTIKALKHVGVG